MPQLTLSLIEKHIQELLSHPHIEQITLMKHLVYKVIYWPQDLDSLYSQMAYTLKLTIPETYPQKPPFLTFLDKIYHLNVHPTSGQVFMSILKEDWSPFLNLRAVISSLDQILEDPDESTAATKDILQEYQTDITTYVQKVKQVLSRNMDENLNIEQSYAEEEQVEEVIEVNDFNEYKIQKPVADQNIHIRDQPNGKNLGIRQLNRSRHQYSFNNEARQASESPTRSNNSNDSSPKNIQPSRNDQLKQPPFLSENSQKGSTENIFIKHEASKNKNESSFTKYENVMKESTQIFNSKSKQSSYQDIKTHMSRYKELISMFSEELAELQKNAEKHKASKRLKKLFEDRCTKLEDMIVELLEISQKARIKLMDNIRKDFSKYQ